MTAHPTPFEPNRPRDDERGLVEALRRGDESAFSELVDRYHGALVRLAELQTGDRMMAEEIAQETWLALWKGIGRFEGHSSLKTWLCRVTMYTCGHRRHREKRVVAFSDVDSPAVDPGRFDPPGTEWAGHWSDTVPSWDDTPEERLLSDESIGFLTECITRLPERQQAVIVLRDVEGLSATEVCAMLEITDSVQRTLLHRARARVRQELEAYLRGDERA
jgi:RNA polymerase sigma-70 factor (ECF subfamily)